MSDNLTENATTVEDLLSHKREASADFLNEIDSQIDTARRELKDAENQIERAAAVERLYENKDFKLIIMDGFLGDDLKRLALVHRDPVLPEDITKAISNDIAGAATFNRYLLKELRFGAEAEASIEGLRGLLSDLEEEREDYAEDIATTED